MNHWTVLLQIICSAFSCYFLIEARCWCPRQTRISDFTPAFLLFIASANAGHLFMKGKKRVIIQQQNYTTWIPFPFAGLIDNSCDLLITAYLHCTIFLLVCMLCMCLIILVQDGSIEMQHLILSNVFGGTESGDHFNIGYMNCSISDVCTSEQKLWDDVRIFSSLFFILYSLTSIVNV